MSEGYNRKSKPTTISYFMMRLRTSGYRVERLFTEYNDNDPRVWTAIIDPGHSSIICTCYVNRMGIDDNFFEFYDGGQFIPSNMKIKTQSIEILISHLVRYGINNKDTNYPKNIVTHPTEE